MSFQNNIQSLRHRQGLTQEQFAELMGVSRQAVSKWEAGGAYPEMDKLLAMCGLFSVDLNTLVHGDVSASGHLDGGAKNYEKAFNRFSLLMALGVFGVLLSVALYLFISGLFPNTPLDLVVMFSGITLSLFLIIPTGIGIETFKKQNPEIPADLYPAERVAAFDRRFPYMIALGVCLIMIGVISMIGFQSAVDSRITGGVFLCFVAAAVFLFVYFGIQKDKFDIERYNRENARAQNAAEDPALAEKQRRSNDIAERVSGAVMILATAVFLFLGFVYSAWSTAWVVFPIGGLLCGLVSVLVKGTDN